MIEDVLENVDRLIAETSRQAANVQRMDGVLAGRSAEAIEQALIGVRQQQARDLARIESACTQVTAIAEKLASFGISMRDPAGRD